MIDIDAVEARYSAALDACDHADLGDPWAWQAMTDALADIPELIKELRRSPRYPDVHDHEWVDESRIGDRDRHEVCTICREHRYIPREVEDVELP